MFARVNSALPFLGCFPLGLFIWNNFISVRIVEGQSMLPTLVPGDRVLVFAADTAKRGDVVVVYHPNFYRRMLIKRMVAVSGDWLWLPANSASVNIAEPQINSLTVALNHDRIDMNVASIKNSLSDSSMENTRFASIIETDVSEPGNIMSKSGVAMAISSEQSPSELHNTVSKQRSRALINRGHCWIEGDNHAESEDSPQFGPVSRGLVQGRVSAVIWPPRRWQWVRRTYATDRLFSVINTTEVAVNSSIITHF